MANALLLCTPPPHTRAHPCSRPPPPAAAHLKLQLLRVPPAPRRRLARGRGQHRGVGHAHQARPRSQPGKLAGLKGPGAALHLGLLPQRLPQRQAGHRIALHRRLARGRSSRCQPLLLGRQGICLGSPSVFHIIPQQAALSQRHLVGRSAARGCRVRVPGRWGAAGGVA